VKTGLQPGDTWFLWDDTTSTISGCLGSLAAASDLKAIAGSLGGRCHPCWSRITDALIARSWAARRPQSGVPSLAVTFVRVAGLVRASLASPTELVSCAHPVHSVPKAEEGEEMQQRFPDTVSATRLCYAARCGTLEVRFCRATDGFVGNKKVNTDFANCRNDADGGE
jgi:hypothetical protein